MAKSKPKVEATEAAKAVSSTPTTDTAANQNVVVNYESVPDVRVDTFFKDVLKEMLIADNDTLVAQLEVANPDGSVTEVEFNIVIVKLENKDK